MIPNNRPPVAGRAGYHPRLLDFSYRQSVEVVTGFNRYDSLSRRALRMHASQVDRADDERFAFDSRRTSCPQCGARRGLARVLNHPGAGKCHACGTFIPPERRARAIDSGRKEPSPVVPVPSRGDRQIVEISRWELDSVDEYTDEHGTVLYRVARYERFITYADDPHHPERDKTFRQMPADVQPRQMNDREGTPIGAGLENVRRVLLGLPAVLSAIRQGHRIVLCEGEKCAHHLNTFLREHLGSGDVATTCAGGARGWRPEYAESLRGAHVVIWPDADTAGQALLEAAAPSLAGIAAGIRVITPDIVERVFS